MSASRATPWRQPPRRPARWAPLALLLALACAAGFAAAQPGDAGADAPAAALAAALEPRGGGASLLITFGNTTGTATLDGQQVATGGTSDPAALRRARRPRARLGKALAPAAAGASAAAVSAAGLPGQLSQDAPLCVPNNKFDVCITSPSKRFALCLLRNADVVLYDNQAKRVYWTAKTAGKGQLPLELVAQGDGNLVAYSGECKKM